MRVADLDQTIKTILAANPDEAKRIALDVIYTEYVIAKLLTLLQNMMRKNPNQEIAENEISTLENFIRDYSGIAKDTLSPPHAPHKKLTIVMLTLAQCLEDITCKSRYQILIPSLSTLSSDVTTVSVYDHDLKLTDFVLSDDNSRIIEILPCLYFAKHDGILKHTTIFNGKANPLSETESYRIINHSPETKRYWAAIQNKQNAQTHDQSYGSFLHRLRVSLANGGKNAQRDGTETEAGIDAMIGIQQFFTWWHTLEEDEKESLSAIKAPEASYDLNWILCTLARSPTSDITDPCYCVEVLGNRIEETLKAHPELFSHYPKNETAIRQYHIGAATQQAEWAHHVLEEAMRRQNYRVTLLDQQHVLSFVNQFAQITDLQQYANASLKRYFSSLTPVWHIAQDLPPENRLGFLRNIANALQAIAYPDSTIRKKIIALLPDDHKIAGAALIPSRENIFLLFCRKIERALFEPTPSQSISNGQ